MPDFRFPQLPPLPLWLGVHVMDRTKIFWIVYQEVTAVESRVSRGLQIAVHIMIRKKHLKE